MTPLAALDAVQAASDGGFFYNHGIVWILAIGMAESHTDLHGLVMDATARHTNANGTIDRGWLQINSIHTDISDQACDDPALAAKYAWDKLTVQGTQFTAWSTYRNNVAQAFFPVASMVFQLWQAKRDLATANSNLNACRTQLAADENSIAALNDKLAAATKVAADYQLKIENAKAALA